MFPNPIHIFIGSTLSRPNDFEGETGFILETKMPSGKIETFPATYFFFTDTTPDGSRLLTILEALEHIRVHGELVVHLDDERIPGTWGMDMPRRWASTGWKTTKGGDVKNWKLWQGILNRTKDDQVSMVSDPTHTYIRLLKTESRKRLEGRKK